MTHPLPDTIRLHLRTVLRRRRLAALARATGLAVAFALVWLVGACTLDRLAGLPPIVRGLLLLVGIGGVAALTVRPLYQALLGRIDFHLAAALAARHNPAKGERLQTVVSQLLAPPEERGSQAILAHLTRQAEADVAAHPPERVLTWSRVVRPWAVAGVEALLVALLFVPQTLGMRALVERFVRPLAPLPRVTTTQLALLTADAAVRQGQSWTIRARATRVPDGAVDLFTSPDGRAWTQNLMTPQEGDRYAFTLPAVEAETLFYVAAGDARSDVYRIRVRRPLAVAEVQARYDYPPYLGRPAVTRVGEQVIEAPVGTEVGVTLTATEPLTGATLVTGDQTIALSRAGDDLTWRGRFTVRRDAPLELRLTGDGGSVGRGPPGMEVRATPDRPPTVRLVQPAGDLRLQSSDAVTLQYQAADDFGLAGLSASVQVNGGAPREIPIPPPGSDPTRQEREFVLDLLALGVQVGDVVAVSIIARDLAPERTAADAPRRRPIASEVRRILVCPASMEVSAAPRLAELRQAALHAAALADALKGAADLHRAARKAGGDAADRPPSDRAVEMVKVNQALAGALESGAFLHQALLRAAARAPVAQDASATGAWVDAARVLVFTATRLNAALLDPAPLPDEPRDRQRQRERDREREAGDALAAAADRARQLADTIRTVAEGELAASVLADLRSLKVKPVSSVDWGAERLRAALKREVEGAMAGLGAGGRSGGDLEGYLQGKAQAAQGIVRGQPRVDFVQIAREWASAIDRRPGREGELGERLLSAAALEALRGDGDDLWARDLQRAARALAAIVKLPEPTDAARRTRAERLGQFAGVLGDLDRERRARTVREGAAQTIEDASGPAEAGRAWLTRWIDAGVRPGLEELALAANAATAGRNYTGADGLDRQLVDRARVAPGDLERAMAAVRDLDQLAYRQELLHRDTAAVERADRGAPAAERETAGDAAAALTGLTVRQADVVADIAQADDAARRLGREGAWATDAQRNAAIAALGRAQGDLAQLAQQVPAAIAAQDAHKRAGDRLQQAQRELSSAGGDPGRRGPATRAHEAATTAATRASAAQAAAIATVAPDRVAEIAKRLAPGGSDAYEAIGALNERVAPAVQLLHTVLRTGDRGSAEKAAGVARDAIQQTIELLKAAQARLYDRDPLAAARVHAADAQAALDRLAEQQREQPGAGAATSPSSPGPATQPAAAAAAAAERVAAFKRIQQSQATAGAALRRAWDRSVRFAGDVRLAGVPLLAAAMAPGEDPRAIMARTAAQAAGAAAKKWRAITPTPAPPDAARDPDAALFRDAVKAYFDTLGKK